MKSWKVLQAASKGELMFYMKSDNAPIIVSDSLTVEDYVRQFLQSRKADKIVQMRKPGHRLIELFSTYTVDEIRALFVEIEKEVS